MEKVCSCLWKVMFLKPRLMESYVLHEHLLLLLLSAHISNSDSCGWERERGEVIGVEGGERGRDGDRGRERRGGRGEDSCGRERSKTETEGER